MNFNQSTNRNSDGSYSSELSIGDADGNIILVINGSAYFNASVTDHNRLLSAVNESIDSGVLLDKEKVLILESAIIRHIDHMLAIHCGQSSKFSI